MSRRYHMNTVGSIRRAFAACVLLLSVTAVHGQTTLFVDDDAHPGGDGTTWLRAYRYLQDALADATEGDEIRMAAGIYTPDQDEAGNVTPGDEFASFVLTDGVRIIGGFRGLVGGGDPDHQDPEVFETILTGDLAGDDTPDLGNVEENCRHVITAQGLDSDLTALNALIITGGHARLDDGDCQECEGAGIRCLDSKLKIADCLIAGNLADEVGGAGMANLGLTTVDLKGCRFIANVAAYGGGMLNTDFTIAGIHDTEFAENAAEHGGAILNDISADVTLIRCTFTRNQAATGGAIRNMHPDCAHCEPLATFPRTVNLRMESCTLEGNIARKHESEPSDVNGGAIHNHWCGPCWENTHGTPKDDESMLLLDDCLFLKNTSEGHGGAIFSQSGLNRLTDCTFIDNVAGFGSEDGGPPRHGGGIFANRGVPKTTNFILDNCQFVHNLAGGDTYPGYGGGIYTQWGPTSFELTNCRFTGNQATAGGGMYKMKANASLNGCTFDHNRAVSVPGIQRGYGGGYADRAGWVGAYNPPEHILRCRFTNNHAESGGGFYGANATYQGATGYSSQLMMDCVFHGNVAEGDGDDPDDPEEDVVPGSGGAICGAHEASVQLTNSVLTGNRAFGPDGEPYAGGAAVHNIEGPTAIMTSVIADNEATRGAGILHADTLLVTNSTVYFNVNDESGEGQIHSVAASPTIAYSNVEGYAGGGEGNIDLEPEFRQRGYWDLSDDSWVPGNYRFRDQSPGIDAGDNTALPLDILNLDNDHDWFEQMPWDLDDRMRRVDDPRTVDTGNGVAPIVDMSAYEYVIVDCNANGVDDIEDIAAGASVDCNLNVVPDECELDHDCNANGVPDECEGSGDIEFDCRITADDASRFDDCYGRPDLPYPQGLDCIYLDIDGDLDVDPDDAAEFQYVLGTTPSSCNASVEPCDDGELVTLHVKSKRNNVDVTVNPNPLFENRFSMHPQSTDLIYQADSVVTLTCVANLPDDVSLAGWRIDGVFSPGASVEVTLRRDTSADLVLVWPDCNDNLVPDAADIAHGTSADADGNGIPDECQPTIDVPSDKFPTIQSAIDAAVDGTIVRVAPHKSGVYVENIRFHGKEILVTSTKGAQSTTIMAADSLSVVTFDDGEHERAILEGFTLAKGRSKQGGGVYFGENVTATLRDCIIDGNTADEGGGVYLRDSAPTILRCVITRNQAGLGGGINCTGKAAPMIDACVIDGNVADHHGGGIATVLSSQPQISNCLITCNTSHDSGGAIYAIDGVSGQTGPVVRNSTIVDNWTADSVGGGLALHGCTCDIRDSILWGNAALGVLGQIHIEDGSLNLSYSDIQGGKPGIFVGGSGELDWGPGNIEDDPLFVSGANRDHRLQSESPCIDGGDPGFEPQPGETDLDGNDRVVGKRVDMGAYEYGK